MIPFLDLFELYARPGSWMVLETEGLSRADKMLQRSQYIKLLRSLNHMNGNFCWPTAILRKPKGIS